MLGDGLDRHAEVVLHDVQQPRVFREKVAVFLHEDAVHDASFGDERGANRVGAVHGFADEGLGERERTALFPRAFLRVMALLPNRPVARLERVEGVAAAAAAAPRAAARRSARLAVSRMAIPPARAAAPRGEAHAPGLAIGPEIVLLAVPLDVPVVVVEAPARAAVLAGARGGRSVVRGRPAAAAHAPVRERGDAAHGVRLRACGRRARATEPDHVRGETYGHARRAHRQVGEHRARAAGCGATAFSPSRTTQRSPLPFRSRVRATDVSLLVWAFSPDVRLGRRRSGAISSSLLDRARFRARGTVPARAPAA